MAYIKNKDIKKQHINKLLDLCGFTVINDDDESLTIRTDNDEIIHLTSLIVARDFLVSRLQIRHTMANLPDIT